MASRDVAAFPREERHQREPVGTRFEEALDEQAEQKEERRSVLRDTIFSGLVLRSVEITR